MDDEKPQAPSAGDLDLLVDRMSHQAMQETHEYLYRAARLWLDHNGPHTDQDNPITYFYLSMSADHLRARWYELHPTRKDT